MRHYSEYLAAKLVSLLFAGFPLVPRFTGSLERRNALAHSFDHIDFFAIRATCNFQTCLNLAARMSETFGNDLRGWLMFLSV